MCYFSIVIPVYNAEKYLKRCIESIVTQEFKDYEVLLLNDQSSDNSLEMCMNYSSVYSNIKTYNLEHCGASEARNQGIKKARGKYILFVDADDYMQSEMLLNLYNDTCDQEPDVCYMGRHYVETDNQKTLNCIVKKEKLLDGKSVSEEIFLKKLVESGSGIPGSMWLIVVKRTFLLQKGIQLNSDYIWSEDSDFCYNVMIQSDKIAISDYAGYVWCIDNTGSVSKKSDAKKILSRMEVYKKWYYYFKNEAGYEESVQKYISNYILRNYCSCLINYTFLKNSREREIVRREFIKDGIWNQMEYEQYELFHKYGLKTGRIIYKYKSYFEKFKSKF